MFINHKKGKKVNHPQNNGPNQDQQPGQKGSNNDSQHNAIEHKKFKGGYKNQKVYTINKATIKTTKCLAKTYVVNVVIQNMPKDFTVHHLSSNAKTVIMLDILPTIALRSKRIIM